MATVYKFIRGCFCVLVLSPALALANTGGPCWPDKSFEPREIDVVNGLKARPADGEPFGVVYGSLGASGSETHLYSRRLVVRMVGTNSLTASGGGASTAFRTANGGKFAHAKPDVACQVGTAKELARLSAYAFRLKPGEYEIETLEIERQQGRGPRLKLPSKVEADYLDVRMTFKVEAGTATYLGELLSAVASQEGSEWVVFQLRDHMARDLHIVGRMLPQVDAFKQVNLVGQLAKVAPEVIRLEAPLPAVAGAASTPR